LAPAVGVLGVLALTLADGRASAQETNSPTALREAEQRFDEGRALFTQRRFSEAHLKFEQACAVHRTVNCPKNLGLTELEMGKYVEATTHLREFLHSVQVSGQQVGMDAEQLAALQKRYNEAFLKCGHVEIAAPAGARIVVNGLVAGTAPLADNTIDVLPGDATVEARTDRGVQKQVVRVSAGEVQPVKFAEPESLPDTAAPVPVHYTPHLVTSATAGPRGTTVTVNGDSFAPGEVVTLRLGSASVQVRADGHGILTNATLTVPSSAKVGAIGLTATGAKSATPASAPFDVTARPVSVTVYRPQLRLAQSGSGVTLRGHGFAPNERVTVSVDGHRTSTATADASGAISAVELPAAVDGGHSVQAAGVRSLDPATASYLVAGGHARTARTGAVHGGPPAHGTPGAPSSGPASPSPAAHAVGRSGGDGVVLWWLIAPAIALLVAAVWWRRRRTI